MAVTARPNYDVVVVGAGLAGHCAALAAADLGASVALLEKTGAPGGSTILSAGSFAFGGTAEQKALGIEDSPERLAQDLLTVSGGKADPDLLGVYIEGQHAAHAWLKRLGVVFHKVSLSSNTSVPRTHPTNPRQLVEALHACVAHDERIEFVPRTAAGRLVRSQGVVQGVEVAADRGEAVTITAKSIVLACGGFARNASMMEKYAPFLRNAKGWGGAGNTGDGIAMALECGAALADMDYVAGTFGVGLNHYPDLDARPGDELLLRMAMYRGAIAVNLRAERFADESLSYKTLGAKCLAQPEGVAFQVFDQPIMNQSAKAPTLNDFEDAYAKGLIRRAPSVGELARTVGLDPDRLAATVRRYNSALESGGDPDFGRRTLGGGYGQPVPLRTPPFYILPCCTAVLSTYCGLRVDRSMRVLDEVGKPIAGLYAAGETVGGFHGAGYMSGSALGKAAIFGLAAGREALGRPAADFQ